MSIFNWGDFLLDLEYFITSCVCQHQARSLWQRGVEETSDWAPARHKSGSCFPSKLFFLSIG